MPKLPKKLSPGEEEFALHCSIYKLTPEREYVFHPGRQWRFDFAWPGEKVAVEIEGGTAFGKSRHSRGAGFVGDCRKYNAAALLEWLVFRFTTEMVHSGEGIDTIRQALGVRTEMVTTGESFDPITEGSGMIRPRSKPRPGRLKGAALQALRTSCWLRDRGCCVRCGVDVWQELPHTKDNAFHMAHKRNKRMWGDTLENVQTECGACHRAWHLNGPTMKKPCPPKV